MRLIPAGLGLAVCVVMLLSGCQTVQWPAGLDRITGGGMTDEEKIAVVLDDVRRGMESKRVYHVLSRVSKNYRDREGRNYDGLRDYLNTLMDNYKDIRITRTPPKIQVRDGYARVVESFGTRAESTNPTQYPPINLQGQMVILMEKNGGEWQILEWGPVY